MRSSRVGSGIGARSATTNNEANPLKSSDSRSRCAHGGAPPQFTRGWAVDSSETARFRREPRGEWICLDAETAIAEGGAGLATATLSDDDGVVPDGAESLLVARVSRPDRGADERRDDLGVVVDRVVVPGDRDGDALLRQVPEPAVGAEAIAAMTPHLVVVGGPLGEAEARP